MRVSVFNENVLSNTGFVFFLSFRQKTPNCFMKLHMETNWFLDKVSAILTQDYWNISTYVKHLLPSQSGKFCWFGKDVRLSPSQGLPQMEVFTLQQSETDCYTCGKFAVKSVILYCFVFYSFFLSTSGYLLLMLSPTTSQPYLLSPSFPIFCLFSIACFLSIDPSLRDCFQLCVLTAWQNFVWVLN